MADLAPQAEHHGTPAQPIEPAAQQEEVEVFADLARVELVIRPKGEHHIAAKDASVIGGLHQRFRPARVKPRPGGADGQAPNQGGGGHHKQNAIQQPAAPVLVAGLIGAGFSGITALWGRLTLPKV